MNGEIPYTISNPVEGTNLTATTTTEWISDVTVDESAVTFAMAENTGAERTGKITLTYGDLTKDIIVKQLAAVAKRTVTIEEPANGTLKVFRGEDEIFTGAQVAQGTVLTIEATPAEGYKFRNWQAVDGSTHTFTTGITYTIGESDVTFKANFDEIINNTITWSVNGVESTTTVEQGSDITFTAPETVPDGYTFMGWLGETYGPSDEAPAFVTSAKAAGDATYYAVFAKGSGSAPTLTKMTASDDFVAGDNIVIVAVVDETTSYGLYQETISNSYVKNFKFDGNVSSIALDNKNWMTVSGSSTDGWILGDETNGYLYSNSSNNLSISSTSQKWILEKDSENDKFMLNNSRANRYLSCRTDLNNDNVNCFRLAGGSPLGIYKFDIYKYVSGTVVFTGYTTTVSDAPTSATLNFVAQNAEGYYATFSSDKDVVFTSDVIVYAANVNGTAVKLNALEKDPHEVTDATAGESGQLDGYYVPANTGVLVYSMDETTTYYFPAETAEVQLPANMLEAATADGVFEGKDGYCYYKLAYNDYTSKTDLGFYYGAADGAPFAVKKGLAYLAVPTTSGAAPARFVLGGDTDAISSVNSDVEKAATVIYTIAGQRVDTAAKPGLYIVNGKKLIVK
ncbi:MAG: hypothetical protein K2L56_06345 [Prevotella sp.]|nr:hypothetical protein [Prevotella sp.]